MSKKIVLTLLASILVIAACASAIIALVHSSKARSDIPSGPGSPSLGSIPANISKLCTPAMYQDSCTRTLSQISPNSSASPADIFKAFVEIAIKELESAASRSVNVSAEPLCQDLLADGLEYLNDVLASLQGKDVQSVLADADTIKHTISASMTHITDCVDSLDDPALSNQMKSVMNNATEMSSNALAVIASISSAEEELESELNNLPAQGPSRRLMGSNLDEEGFPTWLSAGDRKLLQAQRIKPDAVVAQDGSGQYRTIMGAVRNMPIRNGRYVIYVKAGKYNEIVNITKTMNNLFMYGDGQDKTIITGHRSANFTPKYNTSLTPPMVVEGKGFIARDMGFQNTAGPHGLQAVAMRTKGDFSVFYRCRFDAYQDTLYVHCFRQFFRDCTITGTVDFIFGNSAAVFQNCVISANHPIDGQSITITASGRDDKNMPTGLVIQNCQIRKNKRLNTTITLSYLGRPWKNHARVVVMESFIDSFIHAHGWSVWNSTMDPPAKTVYFGEYANTGPGSSTAGRVPWSHRMTQREAFRFTAGRFIHAPGGWLAGTPYVTGFTKRH